MKGPLDRTKVVLRHLPPTISQSSLVEHVDSRFSGRYRWLAFRPGKSSPKHLTYSRAYIDFNEPQDVIEFAEFFNGHVFVNEKGTQFKTIVEYAPSQRVPKQGFKNDGREGTILKDPEYLEFLEFLSKPVENLPSAEIQLERKEAERAGAPKDVPIVTPLMDYVRQKRAAKGETRRAVLNGKPRRVGVMSSRNPPSGSSRRGSEKRSSTSMYVSSDSSKILSSNDKSTYLLVPRKDDQRVEDKSADSAAVLGKELLEGKSGGRGSETGKKKILLLKGKEKYLSDVSDGSSLQQNAATPVKSLPGSAPPKQNLQGAAIGRITRSIFPNRDAHQNQASIYGSQPEVRILTSSHVRGKKPPRPPGVQSFQKDTNGVPGDKAVSDDLLANHAGKHDRRARNRDRPDRGVWTLRRSDGTHSSNESLSSSTSQNSQVVDSAEGTHAETKHEMLVAHGGDHRPIRSDFRVSNYSVENGSYRQSGRRGSAYNVKDVNGSSVVEGKPLRKGGSSGHGSYEKQMWVQKPSSGS